MFTLHMVASYIRIWQIHLQSYNYPSTMIMLCAWATSFSMTCNQKETRCKLWKWLHCRKRKNWTSARYVAILCVRMQNYLWCQACVLPRDKSVQPRPRMYNYVFLKWCSKTSHVGMVTILIFLRNGWILFFWSVPLIKLFLVSLQCLNERNAVRERCNVRCSRNSP